jgi:hypothetical protein
LLEPGELKRFFDGLEEIESVEGLVEAGTTRAWLAGLAARRAG